MSLIRSHTFEECIREHFYEIACKSKDFFQLQEDWMRHGKDVH